MERFLFNREEYDRIYNCSMLTPEEWDNYVKPNVPMGIFFILAGVVYEVNRTKNINYMTEFLGFLYPNAYYHVAAGIFSNPLL